MIEDLKCDNCGHSKITPEMSVCPVCGWVLHPTPEQDIARRMIRVRWGCYKADFYEYSHKHCTTHECKKCHHDNE